MSKELTTKNESAITTNIQLPAGLDGSGTDFLMPRYKVWHPMAKAEVLNAKLGLWYEANSATLVGDTLRFHLLAQRNSSFAGPDGKVKNSKSLLIAKEGNLDFPCEIALSGSGIRPSKGLNTNLMEKRLVDKANTVFQYIIEAKIEVKENDNGKFGVPKFSIVGVADGEAFDKLVGLHTQFAAEYAAGPVGVDTAVAYDDSDLQAAA